MRKQLWALGVLVAAAGSCASVASAAPADDGVDPFIVGGRAATGPTSWMASLQYDAPAHNRFDYHTCGAVLAFRGWAVTAAHCVTDLPTGTAAAGQVAATYQQAAPAGDIPTRDKHFKVRIGSKDRTTGGELVAVTAVTVHPDWKWAAGAPQQPVSDIAVLKLERDVDAQPLQLAATPAATREAVSVYGWGIDQPGGTSLPRQLQQLDTTVTTPTACAPAAISAKERCAANPGGTDGACQGDSGGPVVRTSGRVPQLVGLVSRGAGPDCGTAPDVFTSAPEFRRFIYDTARGKPA